MRLGGPVRYLRRRESGTRREVLTPEGVPLSMTLADPGDRAAAFLVDVAIATAALFALVLLAALAAGDSLDASWVGAFAMLAAFFLRNFYFIFFELRWQGSTPGKRLTGLRVIDRGGGELSADAVIARNLMRDVEVFLPLTVLVAPEQLWPDAPGWARLIASVFVFVLALMPVFNRDRLRIGDLVAGTMVVLAPRAVLLPDLGAREPDPARRAAARVFTPEQLDVYGIYELQVLEDLLRSSGRAIDHDRALQTVYERIAARIQWREDPLQDDAEAFLRDFYAALRAHLEKKLLLGKRKQDKYSRP